MGGSSFVQKDPKGPAVIISVTEGGEELVSVGKSVVYAVCLLLMT